ncbi:hypothetical protein FRB99_005919 [Tulasnella sp. 403]|nr:hypothetical protein FRB99_005919 [Tulasnella sp. 403]
MTQAPKPSKPPVSNSGSTSTKLVAPTSTTADGKEVYNSSPAPISHLSPSSQVPSRTATPQPRKIEEDEDDPNVPAQVGAKCLRNGCNATFVSEEESRNGDGDAAVCKYHPMQPLFREGSKGYLCCKPKVLEFEEFLKIPGCKTGRHVFVKKVKPTDPTEELVRPRIDHYQTPSQVHVSVFAKQVDQARSNVQFEPEHVHLDLYLPAGKRCKQTLDLFDAIDPASSTFKIYGTKVELILAKQTLRAWSLLEKTDVQLPGAFGYTFSAGGRTGSVGAKDAILDHNNLSK